MWKYKNWNPAQIIIFTFGAFILLGTILIKLPFATTHSISWMDALFTAASAMTVTGLAVVDTPSTFTYFGEMVIAALIQMGGLGIMTFAVMIILMLGRKIGFRKRLIIQEALNQNALGGVIRLAKSLFLFSITIEVVGMIFLSISWIPELGVGRGLYYSFFHSISAFNNAGFALWPNSLMDYAGDSIVNITITFLFITGGIGFTVLIELWQHKKWRDISLHSKLMLLGSFIINILAMLIIFLLEYHNPNTLGGLHSLSDKLWTSYFQAVTPRTAGFNTLDIASLEESTIFVLLMLMFIGAGSASTGGGIKLTTFFVIVFSVITFLRAKEEIVIGKRSISQSVILRSLAVTMLGMNLIAAGTFILTITEDKPFLMILFEVISAFGTVGLSMGITGSLTMTGKVIIVIIMFLGKVGPLTLAFAIAKTTRARIKYPSEDVITG